MDFTVVEFAPGRKFDCRVRMWQAGRQRLSRHALLRPHRIDRIRGQVDEHLSTLRPDKVALYYGTVPARLQPTDLEEWIGPDHGLMVGEKRWSGTVVEADRAIEAKPGVNVLTIAQEFRDTDINSVLVRAEDTAGTLLYAQQVPFVCSPPILIEAKTYPKHGRVDIVADISEYREAAPTELAADIAFLDPAGQPLATSAVAQFRSRKETASYELEKLPEGEITVRATLRKIGRPALATSEARFTNLAPGPWLNNTLGRDDIVIPPFEPIRVDGTRVSVWNRTYVWNESLLPVEIHTGGDQVLAAPIELHTGETSAGKPNRAAVSVIRQSPATVVLEAKGELDGIPITARSTIEYDGMIDTELVFEPTASATLPRLALTMPMKTEQAWLYHFHGKGGSVAETENARGPLRGDADVPAQFWLGTPEGGLGFFTVSGENWGPRKEPHVKIDGPVTTYTVPIAGGPFTLTPGMTIRFGLIATPVKPMRDNWRFFRCGRDWGYTWTGPMSSA